jgi:transcriptional regulator with XRE-family HTH domain
VSKRELLGKLLDPVYRCEFVSNEIDIGLPMQLRAMREKRGWKQSFVAEKTGTKQPRFSLMEKPGYGNFSLNTLKKLAALFDVGLIVSFVPWDEMISFVESLSQRRLDIVPFNDEYQRMSKLYSRERRVHTDSSDNSQLSLFSSATNVTTILPIQTTGADYQETGQTIPDPIQVPKELKELIANAHLASTVQAWSGNYVTAK